MCGIVGLFCKSPGLEPRLGEHLSAMLVQMSDRGPDSAGVAVYRDPAPDGYLTRRVVRRHGTISLAAFPQLELRVGDLLG